MTDHQDHHQPDPPAPTGGDEPTRAHAAVAGASSTAPAADGTSAADVDRGHDPGRNPAPAGGPTWAAADDDAWDDEPWEAPAEPALPPRPRRRLVTPATVGLAAVVVAGAGFIGGVQVQKHQRGGAGAGIAVARGGLPAGGVPGGAGAAGPNAGASGGAPAAGRASGGPRAGADASAGGSASGGSASAGEGGADASGGAAGDTTVGEVQNVKGRRLYVTGSDGTTVEVTVGRRATVQRTAKAEAADVHPGDTVVVQGTADENGTVAATAVQATASGVTLGGFGLRGTTGGGATGRSGAGSGGGDAVDQLFGGG